MQLKNIEIVRAIEALNEIQDKDAPVEFTFKLFEISSDLTAKYTAYIQTLHNIMDKAGVDAPEDPVVRDDVDKLINLDVEFNTELISKQELLDSGIKLSLSQLIRLDKLIKE